MPTYPRPYRILFTGSRYWGRNPGEEAQVVRLLVYLRDHAPPGTVAVHGGCPTGLDALVDLVWWWSFGLPVEQWPADWDSCGRGCPADGGAHRVTKKPGDLVHPGDLGEYCPVAGPRRNTDMALTVPDRCYAFYGPFSKGSKGCADAAAHRGVPTWRSLPGAVPPWQWRPGAAGTGVFLPGVFVCGPRSH